MRRFRISNILLDPTPQFIAASTLLTRSTAPIEQGEDPSVRRLRGPGTHDFTTFFNALSVEKWRRYTVARGFHLHLEVRGAAATVTQTRADTYTWESERVVGNAIEVPVSEDWHDVDLDLVVSRHDVLVGFVCETAGDVEVRNGFYSTDVEDSEIRPVELALCTTTFKKERYVEQTIALVKEEILGSSDPIADHVHFHVVDNGRTLDPDALEGPGVSVHPNKNLGGAGGFARGMIEAMEQTPKATHVLLMDDDIALSPQSIIRTYNLLSIANEEYSQAFISGMMMSLDEPALRWEDLGYVTFNGACAPLKWPANMGLLHEAVLNESFEPPSYMPGCGDMVQTYAAWWYCVIPMATIEREGLPLPIFVRCDDVEYGLRVKPKFMTMNGIGVWHLPFNMRYSAAVERYQMMRNSFIAQATTGIAPMSDFTKELYRNVHLELKKFNYDNAELAVQGFEDFLRGPEFISRPVSEKSFLEANDHAEHLVSLPELREQAQAEGITCDEDLTSLDVIWDPRRSLLERIEDFITFNGQRFGAGYVRKDTDPAVIDYLGWAYPAGKIRRRSTLVVIDLPHHKGAIRHLDRARFKATWERFKRDMKFYKQNKERLDREYSAARASLTSVAHWKKELGLATFSVRD